MRQLVLFMHVSLDGFVASPNGEMDWIKLDDNVFEYAGKQTDISDTALYGRKTYEMMEDYWPTAADQPKASKHDKQYAEWYNKVAKIVVSKTMEGEHLPNTSVISHNITAEVIKLKEWVENFDVQVTFLTDAPTYDWLLLNELFYKFGDSFPKNLS